MVEIRYNRPRHRVTIQGHAGTAEIGHDLVCAAVSALALTLAANVKNMEAHGHVYAVVIDLTAGNAKISCTADVQYADSVTQVFNTICAGFELLSKKFSKNVKYRVFGIEKPNSKRV